MQFSLKQKQTVIAVIAVAAIIWSVALYTGYNRARISSVEVEAPSVEARIISSLETKTKELKNKRAEYKRTRTKAVADEIRSIARERKNLLIETARFNPEVALSQILSAEERADPDLKTIAGNDIEQEATIEGDLEVLHSDNFERKNSQTDYFLNTLKGDGFSLHPARGLRVNIFSAKKIKVRGFKVDNELLFNGMGDISAPKKEEDGSGFQVLQEAAALSTVKVVILMANFQNTAQPSITPQEVKDTLNQVNNYYQENSYGRVGISGDVFGWYNIPMNQVCVPNDDALSYAINAAERQGVNFNQYSVVAVYAPFGGPNCRWGGYAKWNGTRRIWLSYIDIRLVAHEIGHQLGVGHANFYDCGAVPIRGSSCRTDEYGDPYDVMGSGDGHFNAIHKIQKGWLTSSNIRYVTQNGLYTIEPTETNTNGFKVIKVKDYFIEYRQPIGFDKALGGWSNTTVFDGALFGIGSTLLLDANASPTDLAQNIQAALKLGETFFIPSTNITITPVSKTPEALTLDIRFDGTMPSPTSSNSSSSNSSSSLPSSSSSYSFSSSSVSSVVCSAGFVRACIDSVSPNPTNEGQNITFTGHGENDSDKPITAYRWRLDSISGKTLISRESIFSTNAVSSGTHTIYFRVSIGKAIGGWSDWISKEFTVNDSTQSSSSSSSSRSSSSSSLPGSSSSASSSSSQSSIPSTIPAAPSNVRAKQITNKPSYQFETMEITWQDNSLNEERFEMERKFSGVGWQRRGSVPSNSLRFLDESAASNYTYTYRIRACNSLGCSVYIESNSVYVN